MRIAVKQRSIESHERVELLSHIRGGVVVNHKSTYPVSREHQGYNDRKASLL